MNLHNVRFAVSTIGEWLSAFGGNGRPIGVHIWMVEEGDPPENTSFTRPAWQSAAYWTPPVFAWRAFSAASLFRNGYVTPICGHRSQARRIRFSHVMVERYPNACPNCARIANERGIIVATYDQAQEMSAARAALLADQIAWQDAGRPAVWPIP